MSSYKVSYLQICVLAFIGLVGIEAMALLMATSCQISCKLVRRTRRPGSFCLDHQRGIFCGWVDLLHF